MTQLRQHTSVWPLFLKVARTGTYYVFVMKCINNKLTVEVKKKGNDDDSLLRRY